MADAAVAGARAPGGGIRGHLHLRALIIGALVLVVIGAAATLFGWDLTGWLKHIWDTIKSIPLGYLVAGIALTTLQTAATAFAWYSILRYAYPDSGVAWLEVFAIYAAAVALNFVLPANMGTLAMLLMFNTTISGASFSGCSAAWRCRRSSTR